MSKVRSLEIHFRSTAFNTTEPRPHFINACSFGDDVCVWLIGELKKRGIETDDEPRQEDFGWYFDFVIAGTRYCFVTSFQPNDPAAGDQWIGWVERDCGFILSILGGRTRKIAPAAIDAITDILRNSGKIIAVS